MTTLLGYNTTNESNANHLKSIFNKVIEAFELTKLIIREIKLTVHIHDIRAVHKTL